MQSEPQNKDSAKNSKRLQRQALVRKYGLKLMNSSAWFFKHSAIVLAGVFIIFAGLFMFQGSGNYALAAVFDSFWIFGICSLTRLYCNFIGNYLRETEVEMLTFD